MATAMFGRSRPCSALGCRRRWQAALAVREEDEERRDVADLGGERILATALASLRREMEMGGACRLTARDGVGRHGPDGRRWWVGLRRTEVAGMGERKVGEAGLCRSGGWGTRLPVVFLFFRTVLAE